MHRKKVNVKVHMSRCLLVMAFAVLALLWLAKNQTSAAAFLTASPLKTEQVVALLLAANTMQNLVLTAVWGLGRYLGPPPARHLGCFQDDANRAGFVNGPAGFVPMATAAASIGATECALYANKFGAAGFAIESGNQCVPVMDAAALTRAQSQPPATTCPPTGNGSVWAYDLYAF